MNFTTYEFLAILPILLFAIAVGIYGFVVAYSAIGIYAVIGLLIAILMTLWMAYFSIKSPKLEIIE